MEIPAILEPMIPTLTLTNPSNSQDPSTTPTDTNLGWEIQPHSPRQSTSWWSRTELCLSERLVKRYVSTNRGIYSVAECLMCLSYTLGVVYLLPLLPTDNDENNLSKPQLLGINIFCCFLWSLDFLWPCVFSFGFLIWLIAHGSWSLLVWFTILKWLLWLQLTTIKLICLCLACWRFIAC